MTLKRQTLLPLSVGGPTEALHGRLVSMVSDFLRTPKKTWDLSLGPFVLQLLKEVEEHLDTRAIEGRGDALLLRWARANRRALEIGHSVRGAYGQPIDRSRVRQLEQAVERKDKARRAIEARAEALLLREEGRST